MCSKAEETGSISELISKDLKLSLYGSWNTALRKTKSKIEDKIMSFQMYNIGIQGYHTAGSVAEGTVVETSDSDMMDHISRIEVLTSRNACFNVKKDVIYLVSDSSKCNPGYVRLAPSEHNISMYHSHLKTNLNDILQPMPDGSFLSSEWFRYLIASLKPDKVRFPNAETIESTQHGPCAMVSIENLFFDSKGKIPLVNEHDVAYALGYRGWPDEANEWRSRVRQFNWPTPTLVKRISEMGCHVVPVGDSCSVSCSVEWRQSFLLCEKELIWNFNDTQIHCYVILKRIIRTCINPLAPDQISSYNLKTVVFWVSEEQGLSLWIPTNLLSCVKTCLIRLSQCVERRNLPHFFIRKGNLFRYRFLSPYDKKVTLEKIKNITNDIVASTMDAGLPTSSEIFKLWNSNKNVHMVQANAINLEVLTEKFQKELALRQKIELHRTEFLTRKRFTLNFVSEQSIDDSVNFLNEKPFDDDAFAKRTAFYLRIRRGFEYMQRAKKTDDVTKRKVLERIALAEIQSGSKLDSMSGQLYLATYYLSILDIKSCISVIEKCLSGLPRRMLYMGFCSSNLFLDVVDRKCFKCSRFDIPLSEINALEPAYDMLFAKEDFEVVPSSLTFACHMLPGKGDRYVVMHPFIYAYHLLHIAKVIWTGPSMETKEILDYLEGLVETECGPAMFHAINAVGYSQLLVNKNLKAFENFILSLVLTLSMPYVKNSAAWFIGIIIQK